MIKTVVRISLILSIFLVVHSVSVSAYSDELFKFDIPDTYKKEEISGKLLFNNSKDENKTFMIEKQESKGLKKSVWDIDEIDLERIISVITIGSEHISTDKRAKLGKEKAIKTIEKKQTFFGDEELYIERYILASNNYIYIVSFVAETEEELKCEDYKMIKESFKLKDRTTNPIVIYILIVVAVIAIKIFINNRKQRNMNM